MEELNTQINLINQSKLSHSKRFCMDPPSKPPTDTPEDIASQQQVDPQLTCLSAGEPQAIITDQVQATEQNGIQPRDQLRQESADDVALYPQSEQSFQDPNNKSKGYFSLVEYSIKRERDNRGRFVKDKSKPKVSKTKAVAMKAKAQKLLGADNLPDSLSTRPIHLQMRVPGQTHGAPQPSHRPPYFESGQPGAQANGTRYFEGQKPVISDNSESQQRDQTISDRIWTEKTTQEAFNSRPAGTGLQTSQGTCQQPGQSRDEFVGSIRQPGDGSAADGHGFQIINQQLHYQNKIKPQIDQSDHKMKYSNTSPNPNQTGLPTSQASRNGESPTPGKAMPPPNVGAEHSNSQITFGNISKMQGNTTDQGDPNSIVANLQNGIGETFIMTGNQAEENREAHPDANPSTIRVQDGLNQTPSQGQEFGHGHPRHSQGKSVPDRGMLGSQQYHHASQNSQIVHGSQNRALNIDRNAAKKYLERHRHPRRGRPSGSTSANQAADGHHSSGQKFLMRTRTGVNRPDESDQAGSGRKFNRKSEMSERSNSLLSQPAPEGSQSPKNTVSKSKSFDTNGRSLKVVNQPSSCGQNDDLPKAKKTSSNSFADCLKIYRKMFQFNWDLKEIINSRHSPKEELTAGAFWFYMNTTFFPDDMLETMTTTQFEEWILPIQENLNTFRFKEPVPAGEEGGYDLNTYKLQYSTAVIKQNPKAHFINKQNVDQELMNRDEEHVHKFSHVEKLIGKRKRLNRFKRHLSQLKDRAQKHPFDEEEIQEIQEQVKKIPKLEEDVVIDTLETKDDAELEIALIKEKIEKSDFQKMLVLAEKDLASIQLSNYEACRNLFFTVKDRFEKALKMRSTDPEYLDMTLYKGEMIGKPNQEFFARVEPAFVQDMVANKQWYIENMNRYLLNINYPCKLQTECLKQMELLQQRRNDQKYRKILDQMDKLEQIKQLALQGDEQAKEELMKKEKELGAINLNQFQRSQIAQEDALCAICGIGDFEDNDQIVFCFVCSMPVHQSCFGLEIIPETDWICNNCATYGLQRGLMIKCMLCPKRGGAMKPTNIFQSYEKFYEQKKINMSKKQGKKNLEKLAASTPEIIFQQSAENNQDLNDMSKSSVMQRIEPYSSLTELLLREEAYYKKTLTDYDERVLQIELSKKDPTIGERELTESMEIIRIQEALELNFNKHEIKNHKIPEDYCNFIKRNEQLLEVEAPPTDTLYLWVHHSCAMWMKEPVVTPKTSVNMKKLDFTRFNQGCFICCKKGPNVGACVKCCKHECQVWFHVECAKRANYCMEIEKKAPNCSNRERVFKIFCESHRPFKILQVIAEQNQKEIEDIQKFAKTIEKAIEIQKKNQLKPKKVITKTERNKMLRTALQNKKQELIQMKKEFKMLNKPNREKKFKATKQKKWTKNDIKILMSRVKEKYLDIMRMRINCARVDPMIAETKRYHKEVRRFHKQQEKRRKFLNQLRQKQAILNMASDREAIVQERGLRVRNRHNESVQDMDQQSFEGGENSQQMQIDSDDSYDDQRQDDDKMEDGDGLNTNEQILFEEADQFNTEMQQNSDSQTPNGDNKDSSSSKQNKITLDLEMGGNDQDRKPSSNLPKLQEIPAFYKHATPLTISELEWTVTLSRYDFPWNEIRFDPFSARECYKMYRSQVTDPEGFLQKVLGDKVQKYWRMMYNQINGLPLYDTMVNLKMTKKVKSITRQVQATKNQQKGFGQFGNYAAKFQAPAPPPVPVDAQAELPAPVITAEGAHVINPFLYCKCRGMNTQEFMVCCESGEINCVNGGWLHPECTKDLKDLTQEQIDAIEVWYCEDCQEKINKSAEKKKKEKIKEIKPPRVTASDKKRAQQEPQTQAKRDKGMVPVMKETQLIFKVNQETSQRSSQPPSSLNARKASLIISIDHDLQQQKRKDLMTSPHDEKIKEAQKDQSQLKQNGRIKVDTNKVIVEKQDAKVRPTLQLSRDPASSIQIMSQDQKRSHHHSQTPPTSQQAHQPIKTAPLGFANLDPSSLQSQHETSNSDNIFNLMRAIGQASGQIQHHQHHLQQFQQPHFHPQQQYQQQTNNFENQLAQLIQQMYSNGDEGARHQPQIPRGGATQLGRLGLGSHGMFQGGVGQFQMGQQAFLQNQFAGSTFQQHHNQLSGQSPFQQNLAQLAHQIPSSSGQQQRLAFQLEQMGLQNEMQAQNPQMGNRDGQQQRLQMKQTQLTQQLQQIQSSLGQPSSSVSRQQQNLQQLGLLDNLDTNQLQHLIQMMQQGMNNQSKK